MAKTKTFPRWTLRARLPNIWFHCGAIKIRRGLGHTMVMLTRACTVKITPKTTKVKLFLIFKNSTKDLWKVKVRYSRLEFREELLTVWKERALGIQHHCASLHCKNNVLNSNFRIVTFWRKKAESVSKFGFCFIPKKFFWVKDRDESVQHCPRLQLVWKLHIS